MSAYADGLVDITRAIEEKKGIQEGYGLGGPSGYGSNYENDVFMMHRYCWCDRPDCPWCRCCNCAWGGDKCSDDCPANQPTEPNFRHKASGLEIRWYKYIGRGEEVSEDIGWRRWRQIVDECIASVDADPRTPKELGVD